MRHTFFLLFFLSLTHAIGADRSTSVDNTPPAATKNPGEKKSNRGVFPADVPKVWNDTGRRFVEINLYGGPSFANSGGVGAGARLTIEDLRATEEGFGFHWEGVFGGGFYPGGSGTYGSSKSPQQMQAQVVGAAAAAVGYYGLEGLKNGISGHALLEFVQLSVTAIGNIEQMYSYNPMLEVGLHGRDDERDSFWRFNLNGGINLSYVKGELEKLNADGSVNNTLLAPFVSLELSTDQRITPSTYLRLEAAVSDTIDSLGSGYGTRNIFQINTHAFLKMGKTLYTGPQFIYTNQQKTADPTSHSYVAATAQWSISWLIGGTVAAF